MNPPQVYMCKGGCKPLGSLDSLPSHAAQPSGAILCTCSPCFLHPQFLSNHGGGGSIPWFAVLEALIHIWRPEIADGCDISCSLIWLRYFHFTVGSAVKNPPANKSLRRYKFYPWVGKIPWRRKWQPIPVFLPGESPWTEEPGRIQSIGSQKSRIGLKRLSTHREEGEAADTRGTSKEKSAVL